MSDPSVATRDEARQNMVDNQLRANKVHDDRVLDAFLRLQRELFVPPGLRGVAYIDEDLPVAPIAPERCLMEPMVAARLLQALAVQPKDTALVVGAGVGYEAAALGLLARSVIALEDDPGLARLGRSALVDHRIASVTYVEAPLAGGAPRARALRRDPVRRRGGRGARTRSAPSWPRAGGWGWFCGNPDPSAGPL